MGTDPVAYSLADREFTVDTDDTTLQGLIKEYGLNAQLADWPAADHPTATNVDATGTVEFNNPCLNPTAFSATAQQDPLPNNYSGSVNFSLNPFVIEPAKCKINYTCVSVERVGADQDPLIECADFNFDGVMDGSLTDGTLVFTPTRQDYIDGTYEPGEYIVTIRGQPDKASDGRTIDATFKITLVDPCDPPTISVSAAADQFYTLTDLSHPDVTVSFRVEPDFCEVEYLVIATQLNDGSSAVTNNENVVSILYTKDLLPLGQTQKVTVTATSVSKYGTFNAVSESESFVVNFLNPCFDSRFIEITAPAGGLEDYFYTILSGEQTETHEAFTVVAKQS